MTALGGGALLIRFEDDGYANLIAQPSTTRSGGGGYFRLRGILFRFFREPRYNKIRCEIQIGKQIFELDTAPGYRFVN